jgi:hypothetical protein
MSFEDILILIALASFVVCAIGIYIAMTIEDWMDACE